MKLNLKYLKQGALEIEAPLDWEKMNENEKEIFCSEKLNSFSDKDIIEGMYDFTAPYTDDKSKFDEIVLAAVTEGDEEKYRFPTVTWLSWSLGEDVVNIINKNIAEIWTKNFKEDRNEKE